MQKLEPVYNPCILAQSEDCGFWSSSINKKHNMDEIVEGQYSHCKERNHL